jgi:hypothetical protein
VLRDRYDHASEWGLHAPQLLGLPLDVFDVTRASFETRHGVPSSWLPASEVELDDLAHAMYLRPAIALEAIAKQHGRARLLRMLQSYARAHRFAHVKPSDFENALDAEYGAGFSEVFVAALAGRESELTDRAPRPARPDAARAVPGRLIALAQLALSWIAP